MMHSHDIRKHNIALIALAALLAIAGPAMPSLHAAERHFSAQPESPLELAKRLKSLTAGGPFNPMQTIPFIRHPNSQTEFDGAARPAAISFGHELW